MPDIVAGGLVAPGFNRVDDVDTDAALEGVEPLVGDLGKQVGGRGGGGCGHRGGSRFGVDLPATLRERGPRCNEEAWFARGGALNAGPHPAHDAVTLMSDDRRGISNAGVVAGRRRLRAVQIQPTCPGRWTVTDEPATVAAPAAILSASDDAHQSRWRQWWALK